MKIVVIETGKTKVPEVDSLSETYFKRVNRFTSFQRITVPDLRNTKNKSEDEICREEAALIQKELQPGDHIILLDEKGKSFTSLKFAAHLQKIMNAGPKRLVFVIGGAYGFDSSIYNISNEKIALSAMTFSHQIIRAIFAEQLYRAFSILNNQPYHHQ